MNRLAALAPFIAILLSATTFAGDATRAMWVYKTAPIEASAPEQAHLFGFCRQRGITDLFWQAHFDRANDDRRVMADSPGLRAFLRAAHQHALRIHALGGDPAHTLARNHPRVLAMADGLIAFNVGGQPGETFDGLHLDIEPHALPEWKKASPAEKCDLLTQFVTVHTLAAGRLHTAAAHLLYGADIVFWLDKTNPDGSPAYPVTFRGITKDAAKHLLDVVDNVGIMSYRDTAEGRNGILALVEKTIAYADTARGRAFVGVKMAGIGPKNEGFFGQTEAQMMAKLRPVDDTCRTHRGYAGLAFFMYEAFKVMPHE